MADVPRRIRWVVRGANRPFRPLARGLFDLEVTGAEHLPPAGPVVVAANHLSHVDPVLVTSAADRPIRFLAVDELFGRSRIFDRVTGFFDAIPLDRDGVPLQALRTALDHLDAGGAVGVFPEGRRVVAWGEEEPKRGAAWMALRSGAPLVPVAIAGSEGLLSPVRRGLGRPAIRLWILPEIDWTEHVDAEDPVGAMTDAWRRSLDGVLRSYPGYAGNDVDADGPG